MNTYWYIEGKDDYIHGRGAKKEQKKNRTHKENQKPK